MCCISDGHHHGVFRLSSATPLRNNNVKITGYLDRRPKNFSERCAQFFQRVELAEKIGEVADEVFHLFRTLLKAYASKEIYEFFLNIHHGAHHLESCLHAVCFFGDANRLISWLLIDKRGNQEAKDPYLKTAARVIHTISHFFAMIDFLNELKIFQPACLVPLVKYKQILSAVGYGLWAISVIYERCVLKKTNHHFKSDLAIHVGGAIFEILKSREGKSQASFLTTLTSLAGIIHAGNVALRLMPPNKERIEITVQINGH